MPGRDLSSRERRQFRRLERGLRNTDPAWLARHHPWRRRGGDLARVAAVVLAVALSWTGVAVAVAPLVFCGILVGTAAATSFVSSRTTTAPTSDPEPTGPARVARRTPGWTPGSVDDARR